MKHGKDTQVLHDLPSQGKHVTIQVQRQRFRCKACHKTFFEPLPDLDEKRLSISRHIWSGYINRTLIPVLCRKSGIPLEDSRGKITSHRARATIASMLYNAKEPLTMYELMHYLGHKKLSSTQSYVQVDPMKLANKVAKTWNKTCQLLKSS